MDGGELAALFGALVVVLLVAVLMGRRLVRFTVELFGLKVDARSAGSDTGVRVNRARAGRHIVARNTGPGGTTLNRVQAEGDIRASSGDDAAKG